MGCLLFVLAYLIYWFIGFALAVCALRNSGDTTYGELIRILFFCGILGPLLAAVLWLDVFERSGLSNQLAIKGKDQGKAIG